MRYVFSLLFVIALAAPVSAQPRLIEWSYPADGPVVTAFEVQVNGDPWQSIGRPVDPENPALFIYLVTPVGTNTVGVRARNGSGTGPVVTTQVVVAQPPPGSVAYLGCFKDTDVRALPIRLDGDIAGGTTPDKCIAAVRAKGLPIAGLQNGYACFGGSTYDKYGAAPEGDCSVPCSGDSTLKCGGGWRNGVWTVQ